MQDFIARHNIERFHTLLSTAGSEDQRRILLRLLAEEEEKLRLAIQAERLAQQARAPPSSGSDCERG